MEITTDNVIYLAKEIARQVVEKEHKYSVTYENPSSVCEGLRDSMGEELTAVNWYEKRAADARSRGDEDTARVYEGVIADEKDHYNLFSDRYKKIAKEVPTCPIIH